MKATTDHDKIIRYANAISILTRETVSTAKIYLGIDEALKKVEVYGN